MANTALTVTLPLGSAVLVSSLSASALALRPFTVVRTRGVIFVSSDQSANTENQALNYGHIVVSDQARSAGIASVPTPVAEDNSDWYVFETLMAAIRVATAASVFSIGESRVIDSKAMRKVDVGQDIVSVVESNATGISEGSLFRVYFCDLIKLH